MKPLTVAWIALGEDEWGNELMRQRALEFFEARPDVDVVHVDEHSGWWLWFARRSLVEVGEYDDPLVICGTANDQAVPSKSCLKVHALVKERGFEYVPDARAGNGWLGVWKPKQSAPGKSEPDSAVTESGDVTPVKEWILPRGE